MGPVLGLHARTDRIRDTRVTEPWLPAPEDRRPGEGQCNGSSDSTQLYTDVIRISMILRCTLVQ